MRTAAFAPRTLILFQTGVPLERDLFGEADDTNVAERYLSDLEASTAGGRTPDHELKVFLLGNGRCGKSSLARQWIHGEFRVNEKSTHGVRLWEQSINFTPIDGSYTTAKLNIWDFAGQDLYHSTHRLFLQSRAIFIICHTEHPPGADEQSDRREAAALAREGEDVHRPLQYWLDQVKSLGKIPGLDVEPPVLIVRTKADRDIGAVIANSLGTAQNDIVFSAKTGDGLAVIEDWVKDQVKRLLGRFEERSLPTQAMAVKLELEPKIRENQASYWEMDESQRVFQSPYPSIRRVEFDAIVRKRCTGAYAEKPELLLQRFHRSGFLYYNAEYLANDVILDQRWAVQGIYVFSSRQSEFNIRELLRDSNGQFTADQLSRFSWEPAGYDDRAQSLFLSFMLACGMCFELLRSDETTSGLSVYAAPGFFPTRAKTIERFSEWFEESSSVTAKYVLTNVTETDVRALIANLGAEWSRSMHAWRWGCRIRSFASGAVCMLDWPRPDDSLEYSFPMTVRFAGPIDRPFEALVRERAQRFLRHAMYVDHQAFSEQWRAIAPKELEMASFNTSARGEFEHLKSSTGRDAGTLKNATPNRTEAVGIRVTFSFAGSQEEYGLIGEIPSLVGEQLNEWFAREQLGEVLCYDRFEGEERLSIFLQNLARGDIVLVFWSRKYWDSEYCMSEMMLIFKEPPYGRLIDKRILIFVFENQRLSKNGLVNATKWEDRWVKIAEQRDTDAGNSAGRDLRRKKKLLKRDEVLHDWYEFVTDEPSFDEFVRTLTQYRLSRSLAIPRTSDEAIEPAEEIVARVKELLKDPVALIDLAVRRMEQNRHADAITILLHALAMRPDAGGDVLASLASPSGIPIPEKLRRLANDFLGDSEKE